MLKGFSKLNRQQKIKALTDELQLNTEQNKLLSDFFAFDADTQQKFEGFSENVLSSYPFPFSIAPNFLINNQLYHVPMVIEESSVVAAASYAARFWAENGGFQCTVKGTKKVGQIFFTISEKPLMLQSAFPQLKESLLEAVKPLEGNMKKRGGGVLEIELVDHCEKVPFVYELQITFETKDSMGANFINSCLEAMSDALKIYVTEISPFDLQHFEVVMSILSNYTPECVVECKVECPVEKLEAISPDKNGLSFARKFVTAVQIAEADAFRATTHNKGIYNGISAVLLATANDFRAVEAAGHAYAARNQFYRSLSSAEINDGIFSFKLEVPLALGTVGGLTKLHPMAKLAFEILGNPDAKTLMGIVAAAGLANNFAAVRSLVTTGIQAGHMKMHLNNILQFEQVNPNEKEAALKYFEDKTVTYSGVKEYISALRKK